MGSAADAAGAGQTGTDGNSPDGGSRPKSVPPGETAGAEVSAGAGLACAALQVLCRVSAHAGCVAALGDEGTARLLFHLVHIPPSRQALLLVLQLLRALAGQNAVQAVAAGQAGALYVLYCLLAHVTAGTTAAAVQAVQAAAGPLSGAGSGGGSTSRAAVTGSTAGGGVTAASQPAAAAAVSVELIGLLSRLLAAPSHGTAISLMLQVCRFCTAFCTALANLVISCASAYTVHSA